VIRLLIVVPLALAVASVAAAIFLVVAATVDPRLGFVVWTVLDTGWWALFDGMVEGTGGGDLPNAGRALAGLAKIAFGVLALPIIVVALASEAMGARSFAWQAGMTALVTAAVPFIARGFARAPSPVELHIAFDLALVGAVAGATYWLLTGRNAGGRQREAARMRTAKAENRPANE
jgi:hypothetical protein